ncbi:MAG: SIMPL domain-containing protein [Candidatus Pacebacteria bacterium]|nr:SIMPL domain-containing protein [Candidatus Paceibacterota bacterium]
MEAQYFEKEARNENPIIKILMIVGIVFLVLLMIYTVFAIQKTAKETTYIGASGNQSTINISETGTVYSVPDVAVVTFTAITQESTINEALRKNNDKANGIIDFLKRQGILESDMKIVDFNIYPQYEWQTKGVDLTVYPLGKRVITAYQAVESVEVKMRDTDLIGRNIQGSLEAGASQVSGLQFMIDKQDDLKKQARETALANAQTKAQEIAKKMGVRLGKAVGYTESVYAPVFSATDKATAGTGSNFQIVVGENKIEVTVNVSYEIK